MGDATDRDLSVEDRYDGMEVVEPYTTGEIAAAVETPKTRVRTLLERLSTSGRVRKKEPEPKRTIWIRTPPTHDCGKCGYAYEVEFLHPVLSAVRFCPRCSTRIES